MWNLLAIALLAQTNYDLVIRNARVMDPASGLDAVRTVGIAAGKIAIISEAPVSGRQQIDGSGLVLSPGFIDLHWHGTNPASGRYQLMDGVTTTLELEIGVADLDKYYAERQGKSYVNFGASIGHPPVRMAVLGDKGEFVPSGPAGFARATPAQLEQIKQRIEAGLRQGAVAVGFGIAYTHGASYGEIIEMFRLAAKYNATCHVHLRGTSSAASVTADRELGLSEVIAAAAIAGAKLHVVHINSSGQEGTAQLLRSIADARAHGVDVTTEAYPYTAGLTRIESALFDSWTDRLPSDYQNLQWSATGERLTRETFLKYRRQGGLVLTHANTEERVRTAILSPLTMIASDGFDVIEGQGHPRSAGTFSRVLAKYVREEKSLSLMDALRKMTIMPAQRLEGRVPAMRQKGRIALGADADLTLFDPTQIRDQATYEKPAQFSVGVRYVLLKGQVAVREGKPVDSTHAGQPIRAPVSF
ncbi:MAG: amidohydrolase family protein [Bryobacteraceae bacterium]|nr:amidohydrolase family protein [Bryobacteraceae bacterium]